MLAVRDCFAADIFKPDFHEIAHADGDCFVNLYAIALVFTIGVCIVVTVADSNP